jgi:hypothetical protein
MTIDISVHCRRKPTAEELIRYHHITELEEDNGVRRFRCSPPACDGGYIIRVPTGEPKILTYTIDREFIDENFGKATLSGIVIPEGLMEKLIRDYRIDGEKPHTLIMGPGPGTMENPLVAREDDATQFYTFRADRELHEFTTQCPQLEDLDPWIKEICGVARLLKGEPTYRVELCTFQGASQRVLEHMMRLTNYFAVAFDGAIYEDQTNRFGVPDATQLHSMGMDLIRATTEEAKKKGGHPCAYAFENDDATKSPHQEHHTQNNNESSDPKTSTQHTP